MSERRGANRQTDRKKEREVLKEKEGEKRRDRQANNDR